LNICCFIQAIFLATSLKNYAQDIWKSQAQPRSSIYMASIENVPCYQDAQNCNLAAINFIPGVGEMLCTM
jgi:hypothetical protein